MAEVPLTATIRSTQVVYPLDACTISRRGLLRTARCAGAGLALAADRWIAPAPGAAARGTPTVGAGRRHRRAHRPAGVSDSRLRHHEVRREAGDGVTDVHRRRFARRSPRAPPPAAAASSCRPAGSSPARSISRAASTCTWPTRRHARVQSAIRAAYLPVVFTRFEGIELMNYSPFIYAFERDEHRGHRAAARSTARRTPTHWWPWKGGASESRRTRRRRLARG